MLTQPELFAESIDRGNVQTSCFKQSLLSKLLSEALSLWLRPCVIPGNDWVQWAIILTSKGTLLLLH